MVVSKRQVTEVDREFVRSVHHRAYRDVVERQYGRWDLLEQDRLFDPVWIASTHEIILCDSIPCGYCCVEPGDDVITVHEIVIDTGFQGRGIGTRILADVMEAAATRGLPVRLQTHIVNRAADLYRRLGFYEIGRTDRHILMEWRQGESH